MGLRALARVIVAGALACALSACWMSEKPLITDSNAAKVAFEGKYVGSGDGDAPKDMTIISAGTTSYALADENDERLPVRFLALRDGWYLMQAEGHSDEEGSDDFYLYQLARPVDGDLYLYAPDCADVPGKFSGLKRESVVEGTESDAAPLTCNFAKLDGLKQLALAAVAGIEKGELKVEPGILKRTGP